MKNNTNKYLKGMASHFSATVMLFLMGCLTSFAGVNKLYIEPFEIAPGETKEVQILLDNEDPISSLEFVLSFSGGISLEEGTVTRDASTNRVTKNSHKLLCNPWKDGYKCGLIAKAAILAQSAIKGHEGSILTLKVKADNTFSGTKKCIFIKDIYGSSCTDENTAAIEYAMENQVIEVSAKVGEASALENEISVRPLEVAQVGVALSNLVEVANIQAIVTFPEGVASAEDENGDLVVFSDRISDNADWTLQPTSEPNKYILLIESIVGDVVEGNEGPLFYLNVAAEQGFKEGEIVISDMVVSSKFGLSYSISNIVKVNVKSFADPSGDGMWDIDDVTAVIKVLNNPEENSVCDLNGDGVVDIDDVLLTIIETNKQ